MEGPHSPAAAGWRPAAPVGPSLLRAAIEAHPFGVTACQRTNERCALESPLRWAMRQVLKDSAHRHTVWERNLQAMRSVVGLCVAWLSGRCGVRRLRVCGVCVHCDPNVCAPQGCTYADGWVWDTRCMGSSAPQCERLGKPRRRAPPSILQPQRAVADVRWLATRSASACLMSVYSWRRSR